MSTITLRQAVMVLKKTALTEADQPLLQDAAEKLGVADWQAPKGLEKAANTLRKQHPLLSAAIASIQGEGETLIANCDTWLKNPQTHQRFSEVIGISGPLGFLSAG